MFEDTNTEIDIFEDDFGLLVAEGRIRDIADELEELHYRRGSHFIWQLKVITSHPSFKQLSITRKSLEDTNFFRTFIRRFIK